MPEQPRARRIRHPAAVEEVGEAVADRMQLDRREARRLDDSAERLRVTFGSFRASQGVDVDVAGRLVGAPGAQPVLLLGGDVITPRSLMRTRNRLHAPTWRRSLIRPRAARGATAGVYSEGSAGAASNYLVAAPGRLVVLRAVLDGAPNFTELLAKLD